MLSCNLNSFSFPGADVPGVFAERGHALVLAYSWNGKKPCCFCSLIWARFLFPSSGCFVALSSFQLEHGYWYTCLRWHLTAVLNNSVFLFSVIRAGARPCQPASPSPSCSWKTSGFYPHFLTDGHSHFCIPDLVLSATASFAFAGYSPQELPSQQSVLITDILVQVCSFSFLKGSESTTYEGCTKGLFFVMFPKMLFSQHGQLLFSSSSWLC